MEETKSGICIEHNKKFIFFCFESKWHFIRLCEECVPIHCEEHAKNKTIAKLKKISHELTSLNDDFVEYKNKIAKSMKLSKKIEIQDFLNNCEKFKEMLNSQFDIEIHKIIEIHLEKVRNSYCNYLEKHFQILNNKKNEIDNILSDSSIILNSLNLYIGDENLVKSISQREKLKKINFEEISLFYQKIDLILQKSEIEILEKNVLKLEELLIGVATDFFDLKFEILEQTLDHTSEISHQNSRLNNSKVDSENKNKSKFKKPKKHICSDCQIEMDYVSDFKKSVKCKICGKSKSLVKSTKDVINEKTAKNLR